MKKQLSTLALSLTLLATTAPLATAQQLTPAAENTLSCDNTKVAITLDNSGSFNKTDWEEQRQAVINLTKTLAQGGAHTISYYNYASSPIPGKYNIDITTEEGLNEALDYIKNLDKNNGGTNWGASLQEIYDSGTDYDAIIFSSDGQGTDHDNVASKLRDKGTRIIGLFIGDGDGKEMGALATDGTPEKGKDYFSSGEEGSIGEAFQKAVAQACEEALTVDYPNEEVKVGGPEVTVEQNAADTAPEGSTHSLKDNWTAPEGWTVTVDKTTGTITASAVAPVKDKDSIDVPITTTTPSENTLSSTATITANKPVVYYHPDYPEVTITFDETTQLEQTGDSTIPEDSTYAIDEQWTTPEGWEVNIDDTTGEITAHSALHAKDGDRVEVPVIVTHADGTTSTATAIINVEVPSYTPSYPENTIGANETINVNQEGDTTVPETSTYAIDPEWEIPGGWDIAIDEATGEITARSPQDAKDGDRIEIPVIVTHANGDTNTTEAVINVEVPPRPVLAATGANVLFAGIAGIVLAVIAGAVVVSRRRS